MLLLNRLIHHLKVPPAQVEELKFALNGLEQFDTENGTQYRDRLIQILQDLEHFSNQPPSQLQGTEGILKLPQQGVKKFVDGDFEIEFKELEYERRDENSQQAARAEILRILADFGFFAQVQGVLYRS